MYYSEKIKQETYDYWFNKRKEDACPELLPIPICRKHKWMKYKDFPGVPTKSLWHLSEERLGAYFQGIEYRGGKRIIHEKRWGWIYLACCGVALYEGRMFFSKKTPFDVAPIQLSSKPPKGVCPLCYRQWIRENGIKEKNKRKSERGARAIRMYHRRREADKED